MYRLLESGRGKLFCYTKGLVPLNDNLSQKQLKELFNAKCEFVIYEQTTTESEASTQEPVHSEAESDSSNGGSRRKANNRKGSRKPKTD